MRRKLPKKCRLPDAAVEMIKYFENAPELRAQSHAAHLDPIGKPTIAFGHTKLVTARHVREGAEITPIFAEYLLRWDLLGAEWRVRDAIRVPLHDYEYGALVSLAFNLTWRSWSRASFLRLINAGDRAGGAARFKRFVKGGRPLKTLPGLVTRRDAETRLFSGMEWDVAVL